MWLTLMATTADAQRLPMAAMRVAEPVELRRGEEVSALRSGSPLLADDRIVTGPQGRAALQLAGGGQLRLGGDSALRLHSADAPDAGIGGVARMVLERGALRLDARAPLPQDYRLNVGRLRLRVYGGEAWTELGARGENVCLLSGAVEIVTESGTERLDQPGACLLFGHSGNRLPVQADTGEALARKLLRTAFADDVNARFEADQTPPAPGPPVTYEVLPPAAAAATPRWTLVLASFPDAASAEAAAQRWSATGETLQVRRSDSPSGARYRLTLGEYGELAAARAALTELRSRHRDAGEAWVMPLK